LVVLPAEKGVDGVTGVTGKIAIPQPFNQGLHSGIVRELYSENQTPVDGRVEKETVVVLTSTHISSPSTTEIESQGTRYSFKVALTILENSSL
jgi:hypothetical protein